MYVVNPDSLAIITIWTEAQGEPYEGKVAVGEVIRNRMLRNYSSDGTVAGTVARRYQFSAWNDDAQDNALLIRALKITETDGIVQDCIRAWNESRRTNYTKGAVLYCNLDACARPSWAKDENQTIKIGHHTFYSDGPTLTKA